jgi:ferredoxin
VLPFGVFALITAFSPDLFPGSEYWLYALKTLAVGGLLWWLRPWLPEMKWAHCRTAACCSALTGQEGNFTVTVVEKARYVDADRCTGCADCEGECPSRVANIFNQGLDKRKAIYALFPQAVPNTRAIDRDHCLYLTKGVCRKCEKVCDANAINFDDTDKEYDLQVGSIILTPGAKTYDPNIRHELGYGRHKNVVTSLQFERLLSASGPSSGTVERPSDGGHPKRLAWVQCVGSRNAHNANPWCSSVCCMYAAKQSIIAKEHDPEVSATVYYMELRAFGKDFDKYIEKAKYGSGVRYVRAMISEAKLPRGKHAWEEWVRRFAAAMRALARKHPGAFEDLHYGPAQGERAAEAFEAAFSAFRSAGFDAVSAYGAVKATTIAVLGFILEERTPNRASRTRTDLSGLTIERFPYLHEIDRAIAKADTFDYLINALIDGFAANRTQEVA